MISKRMLNKMHDYRPLALLVAAAVLFAGVTVQAAGGDGETYTYYSHIGVRPLIKLDDQVVVQFQDAGDSTITATDGQMAHLGLGKLGNRHYASKQRCFVLTDVNQASKDRMEALCTVPNVKAVRTAYRDAETGGLLLTSGRISAVVDSSLTPAERQKLFMDYGVTVIRTIPRMPNHYQLKLIDESAGDAVVVAMKMHDDPRTVYATPDWLAKKELRQAAENPTGEPLYEMQWHLNNTGQGGGVAGADINVLGAWSRTLGEGVIFGAYDTAFDVDHEDLLPNFIGIGHDVTDGSLDPRPYPDRFDQSHGTNVMGLMCAAANGVGVTGVAPAAKFTASRGLQQDDAFAIFAEGNEDADIFAFALDQNVDVHNNSWGPGIPNVFPVPTFLVDSIKNAFHTGRDGKGMVIVFAMGNSSANVQFGFDSSSLDEVIGVGATDAADEAAVYTNFGPEMDIMAPSASDAPSSQVTLPGIVTTDLTDDNDDFIDPGANDDGVFRTTVEDLVDLPDGDYTQWFSGTSAAAPIAAGVCGLVVAANPELTASQVRRILEHTAVRVQDDEVDDNGEIIPGDAEYDPITSRSLLYSYGRIDADAAVEAAENAILTGSTWPERLADVGIDTDLARLTWRLSSNTEASSVMIVQSDREFQWLPEDGVAYSVGQVVNSDPEVRVVSNRFGQSYNYDDSAFGSEFFALFTVNSALRYSWGVSANSLGDVRGSGRVIEIPATDDGDTGGGPEIPQPSVKAQPGVGVATLQTDDFGVERFGLLVQLSANAQTNAPVVRRRWDFGDGTSVECLDASCASVSHFYEITDNRSHMFVATYSVEDADGDIGTRSTVVEVVVQGGDDTVSNKLTINAVVEGEAAGEDDALVCEAPCAVMLTLDFGRPFNSVSWDLGDGSTASSPFVSHTYQNNSTRDFIRFISVTVTPVGTTTPITSSRTITVTPNTGNSNGNGNDNGNANDNTNDNGGGSPIDRPTDGPCGMGTGTAMIFGMFGLTLIRRKRP